MLSLPFYFLGRFLIAGESFEPLYIYRILHVMDSDGGSSFKYGHQEDAEEFFSSLLNAVHDEMVDITNEVNDRIQGMCAVVCVLTLV